MLKRLVTAAGVDYVQWRALLRVYVMLDYAALFGGYGPVAARRAVWHLLMQTLAFGVLGMFPAFVIVFARDLFFASTLMVSVIASIAALFVLMQAQTLISPDDYAVVGYRPVSSKTYFAARVAGLMTQTVEIVVLTGYASVAAFLIRSGGSARVAAAAFAAIAAGSVFATLGVAAAYGSLLRRVSAARLQKIVAMTAVVGLLAVIGVDFLGFFAFVDVGDRGIQVSVDLALVRNAWTLLYPGVWFSAWVEVARGTAGTFEWVACALSVASMAAVVATLAGRVSTGYTGRVAGMTTKSTGTVKADPAWRLLVNERRALAVLMRHLVRTDSSLQISLLTSIAMAIGLSVFVGLHLPSDPFLDAGPFANGGATFMLFLLPRTEQRSLVMSHWAPASWPFFTTLADRVKIVTGMRDLIAIIVLAPLFLAVAGLFTYAYGNVWHALLDAAMLCATAYLILVLDTLLDPRLPFSVPLMTTRGRGVMPMGSWVLTAGYSLFFITFMQSRHFIYQSAWASLCSVLVLGGAIGGLDLLTRKYLPAKMQKAEYAA